jgi:hypothetical protein
MSRRRKPATRSDVSVYDAERAQSNRERLARKLLCAAARVLEAEGQLQHLNTRWFEADFAYNPSPE